MTDKKYDTPDNAVYLKDELDFLQDIENGLEQGKYQQKSSNEFEKQKDIYAKIAQNTWDSLNKKKVYSLRLIENDVESIKSLAMQKGMPYQTLISSIIHQVATKQISV